MLTKTTAALTVILFAITDITDAERVIPWKRYRNYSTIGFDLESPIVTDFGTWGEPAHCPKGEVVTGLRLKMETGETSDDTALNGIEFYCGVPGQPLTEGRTSIASKVGLFGDWGPVVNCYPFAVGFELKSQKHQGTQLDDTAANNLKLYCQDGEIVEGFQESGTRRKGVSYTGAQMCSPGKAICAIQTQVEGYQFFADDTGLNNVRVKCCDYVPQPVTVKL